MSEGDTSAELPSPVPGVPGPLSFLQLVATASRLYARKPLHLIGAFLLVYGAGYGLGWAASTLDDTAGIVAALAIRTFISVAAAFATTYVTIILADVVVGRHTTRGSVSAILRVHAKELVAAGLFAVVIAFPLEFVLPYISFAIVGPPLVAQVIALEYRSFGESVRRSRELLRGQSGRFLLVLLGFVLIVLVIFYLLVIYGLPFIVPFYTAGMLALYLDVRARAEDLDLETFTTERGLAMDEKPVVGSTPD